MFCSCFFVSFKIDDLGGDRGNMAQALAQWQHLVASSEALDVVHWAMRSALYHCIRIATKIASRGGTFVRCCHLFCLINCS